MQRVAVDIGGTFTDLAWYDETDGTLRFEKVLSTPPHFAEGVHRSLATAKVSIDRTRHFVHGSTVAVNAVIQHTGARTGLVSTEGFSDVYEIGRANRPDTYNLFFEKPKPLVPATLRVSVVERMDASGTMITALDMRSARTAIRKLKDCGVEAVAVCLLHAYANPAHEIALGALIAKMMPGVFVTLSHQVLREYREYERTSTTVLNSYVGPEVSRYVDQIDGALRKQNFSGTFYVMQSNGGVTTAAKAGRAPVGMMESGPAGGIIGAAALGRALGHDNVIAFDMGGTTAKACLVERGLPRMTDQYFVGGYREGYPMRLPVVDIIEVGAGGGSIAWVDAGGALKVGPRSAGASPGPVCYGLGGTEPTVTDGNLVIGRLAARRFLGGNMDLDRAAAAQAIERVVAKPFKMKLTDAAHGIVKIADARMSALVRAITLQRGYDPRDFTMIAFGGGGPLHACAIARELRIPHVLIPPQPGHFSALGMLLTDLRQDIVQTKVFDFHKISGQELESWLAPLEREGRAALQDQGCAASDIVVLRSADMRYLGQEYTVAITLPGRIAGASELKEIRTLFDSAYDRRYGHSDSAVPAQIVNLRIAAIGTVAKPDLSQLREKPTVGDVGVETRPVYFESAGGEVDTPVYQRAQLSAGTIAGPAIIEEHASTIVVHPGDQVSIDSSGCVRIDIDAR